ncbi:cupredoxin domain-containing protein [Halorussus litoreus]|uniref:cupredoxin domain-containing protein n=1 Tax=Halorussus litoreus TaxID=1710536 RepID=UPI000E23EDE3|nr:plastocyanin/azurin family copper-binding protein [Halorussus litoreus]
MNGDFTGDGRDTVGRRAFLRTAGATAAAGATTMAGSDDAAAQEEATRYEFGGEVPGWQGRAPPEIEGETNPTVELEAGTEYTFWFENIDGAPHNIAMQDSEGNTLVESETVTGEGSTASITFTATAEMAQYICLVHPTTMVGDAEVAGEVEGGGEGESGPSVETLLLVAALVMAFVSPVLFALFLFSRSREGDEGEGELTTR